MAAYHVTKKLNGTGTEDAFLWVCTQANLMQCTPREKHLLVVLPVSSDAFCIVNQTLSRPSAGHNLGFSRPREQRALQGTRKRDPEAE